MESRGGKKGMDKAIILNVFDFISFHVCKTLLEKGIEVRGIHVEDSIKEPFSEDKRLEVGRNANFQEQSLLTWMDREKEDNGNTKVIFSLYDLFMLYKEAILQKDNVKDPIINLMDQSDGVVIILPSQMVSTSFASPALNVLKDFLKLTAAVKQKFQFVYLPTIYGPWQPETFTFQRALLSKLNRNEIFKETREDTTDAIYIDDAVEAICDIVNIGKEGRFLLESGRKNHWEMCAAYLNIDGNLAKKRETNKSNDESFIVPVKKVTSISESIAKQTELTQRLYSSY